MNPIAIPAIAPVDRPLLFDDDDASASLDDDDEASASVALVALTREVWILLAAARFRGVVVMTVLSASSSMTLERTVVLGARALLVVTALIAVAETRLAPESNERELGDDERIAVVEARLIVEERIVDAGRLEAGLPPATMSAEA
jgi:hypothetical protein